MPTLFKRLVIATTALYLLCLALPAIQDRFGSKEVSAALSWNGLGAVLPLPAGIARLVAFLYVPVAVGLCCFAPVARWLFAALTIFGLVWSLLGGLCVATAVEVTLGAIVTLGEGAILTLAFTSPLRERFQTNEPAA